MAKMQLTSTWLHRLRRRFPRVHALASKVGQFHGGRRHQQTETGWIARTFGRRAISFLQIGAHDGVTDDTLYPFIIKYGWRGVLVEPVKDLFDQLVANYRGRPGLEFVNSAICSVDGPVSFWRSRKGSENDPHWVSQLGSLDRDVIMKHADEVPRLADYISEIIVDGISFATLLARHHVSQAELVLIDTEGHDYEILRQIDFDALSTRLIIYEDKHLSADKAAAARELLVAAGFFVHPCGSNSIAIRDQRTVTGTKSGL